MNYTKELEKNKDNYNLNIALLNQKVDVIVRDVEEIKHRLDGNYVTVDQFTPVRNVVYGLIAIILTTVIGALLTFIIK